MDGRAIFVREDREAVLPEEQKEGERPPRPPRQTATERPPRVPRAERAPLPSADATTGASSVVAERPARETRACFKCGQTGHLASACAAGETEVAGRKLFVSNLAYSISWQDLKDVFAEFGVVTRADVFQERPGRSKGVGVVVMATPEEGLAAIAGLNGREVRGRVLTVREDRAPNRPAQ